MKLSRRKLRFTTPTSFVMLLVVGALRGNLVSARGVSGDLRKKAPHQYRFVVPWLLKPVCGERESTHLSKLIKEPEEEEGRLIQARHGLAASWLRMWAGWHTDKLATPIASARAGCVNGRRVMSNPSAVVTKALKVSERPAGFSCWRLDTRMFAQAEKKGTSQILKMCNLVCCH